MVFPCKSIEPLSGENIPAKARSVVDLPLPFLPIKPSILPFSTSKDIPFTASNISFELFFPLKKDLLIENFFIPR